MLFATDLECNKIFLRAKKDSSSGLSLEGEQALFAMSEVKRKFYDCSKYGHRNQNRKASGCGKSNKNVTATA